MTFPAAKKSFGQCFLADQNIARIIAESATPVANATVLEIGAGTGALTSLLVRRALHVLAIERDRDLVPALTGIRDALEPGKLVVIEADAVKADWRELLAPYPEPHVIAGNIPYQITGLLIAKAVSMAGEVHRSVMMVQREVAERMAASCGSENWGAMSVYVQSCYRVQIRINVPASCFRPQPQVNSAVVVLDPLATGRVTVDKAFEHLVSAAFSQRRKKLRNSWRTVAGLDQEQLIALAIEAGISLDERGETLPVSSFVRAASVLRRLRQTSQE